MTDTKLIIQQLTHNLPVFQQLLEGLDERVYRWKPKEDKWCMLEILCHLYDEEREDFCFRINFIIQNPGQIPPPFNPEAWVIERKYLEQDYNTKLTEFITERKKSIELISKITEEEWERFFIHPKFGKNTASFFLANWLAHDYLHIRQIIKLKYVYLQQQLTEEDLQYAGDIWQ